MDKYNINRNINNFYREFDEENKFITFSDLYKISNKYLQIYNMIKNNLFYSVIYINFLYDYKKIGKLKEIQNEKYINLEKIRYKNLFNNINGHSLDENQRKAILNDEENTLIIAGAGSGKTLTIIGKIRYLIEIKHILPEEILCISFTNDSVNDIKKALLKEYNYNINVYTFHKLAYDILKNKDKSINISNPSLLDFVINEYFYSNFSNNLILKKENKDIYINIKRLISTFINLFKSNDYNLNKFKEFYFENLKNKNKKIRIQNEILLFIIKDIYILYTDELRSQNQIDFNDMINLAYNNSNYKSNYKYIIIDEYQDTSFTRYKLIKSLKQKTGAKVVAVGDDFQSIYRFTGCDLDIFLNFENYFGKTKILKIENTYRNSKELIDVAGKFIMKNKFQMKKILSSNIHLKRPVVIVYYNNLLLTFEKLLEKIDSDIYVLGRNNKDINFLINSTRYKLDKEQIVDINNESKKIKFLTVHKSKGLEASNTIILNMIDDYLGFPSKIINDKILKFVTNNRDYYPYEEERRLFYVALTRTRNNVYILTKRNIESIFVKEIINNSRKNIQIENELL